MMAARNHERELGAISVKLENMERQIETAQKDTDKHRDDVHTKLTALDTKIEAVDTKIDALGERFDAVANQIKGGKSTLKLMAALGIGAGSGAALPPVVVKLLAVLGMAVK